MLHHPKKHTDTLSQKKKSACEYVSIKSLLSFQEALGLIPRTTEKQTWWYTPVMLAFEG